MQACVTVSLTDARRYPRLGDARIHRVCAWVFRKVRVPGRPPGHSWTGWWRRGESNPRPQALDIRIYVRSPFIGSRVSLPEGQGRRHASGQWLL